MTAKRALPESSKDKSGMGGGILHTSQEWPAVVERMQNNMRTMNKTVITDQEKKEIISYLSDHGGR